jgi:hypothetical protein
MDSVVKSARVGRSRVRGELPGARAPRGGGSPSPSQDLGRDGHLAALKLDAPAREAHTQPWSARFLVLPATPTRRSHMYRRGLACGVAALIAAVAIVPSQAGAQNQASIVVNGDFEQPAVSGLWVAVGPPGFDGWTVDSGTVDIVHELWSAASGAQSLDLTGLLDEPGTISQSLPTTPGGTVRPEFRVRGQPRPEPDLPCVPGDQAHGGLLGAKRASAFSRSTSPVTRLRILAGRRSRCRWWGRRARQRFAS